MNLLIRPLVCSFFLLTGWSATAPADPANSPGDVNSTRAVAGDLAAALPLTLFSIGDTTAFHGLPRHRGSVVAFLATLGAAHACVPEALAPISESLTNLSLGSAKRTHFGILSARKV
jgi:hypothetical protein